MYFGICDNYNLLNGSAITRDMFYENGNIVVIEPILVLDRVRAWSSWFGIRAEQSADRAPNRLCGIFVVCGWLWKEPVFLVATITPKADSVPRCGASYSSTFSFSVDPNRCRHVFVEMWRNHVFAGAYHLLETPFDGVPVGLNVVHANACIEML